MILSMDDKVIRLVLNLSRFNENKWPIVVSLCFLSVLGERYQLDLKYAEDPIPRKPERQKRNIGPIILFYILEPFLTNQFVCDATSP